MKEKLAAEGEKATTPDRPEQFAKVIVAGVAKWEGVIQQLGLGS